MQFKLSLRQVQQDKAFISLYFESSAIADYVEAAPVTLAEKFESAFNINSAVPYLVGSIRTDKKSDKLSGWLSQQNSSSGDTLQIWCKAYKID